MLFENDGPVVSKYWHEFTIKLDQCAGTAWIAYAVSCRRYGKYSGLLYQVNVAVYIQLDII